MTRHTYCLRAGDHRNKIVKSTGLLMAATGNYLTMEDHIVMMMAKCVGIKVISPERNCMTLSVSFPGNVFEKMRKLAEEQGVSINTLILKTQDEYIATV